jgi:hypothetical protein
MSRNRAPVRGGESTLSDSFWSVEHANRFALIPPLRSLTLAPVGMTEKAFALKTLEG